MLFQLFHLHSDCLKELLEAYKHQYISIKSYADIFLNISTFLHVNVYDICAIPNVWVHIGMQGCVCVCWCQESSLLTLISFMEVGSFI